jgi:putative tryptophan/tyrosine transport system substrate-binding protein
VQAQAATPAVGFVGSDTPDLYADRLRAFRLGLKATGYTEGKNVAIEYRWAEGRNDRLPTLTVELVQRQVAVIVVTTTPSALAAKAATTTIPIVFFVAGDPVQIGLVTSLSQPGGNLTGATTLTLEVGAKRLELLHEMVPSANTIAVLVNPASPTLALLPPFNRETYKLQLAFSGFRFLSSKPARNVTSRPPSHA